MLGPVRFIVDFDVGRTNPNRLGLLHWAARGRLMAAGRTAARVEWLRGGCPSVDCALTVDVVIRRARQLDHDNAAASLKPLIDGLFKNALTPDDSPKWLTIGTVTQETDKEWKGKETVEFIVSPRENTL